MPGERQAESDLTINPQTSEVPRDMYRFRSSWLSLCAFAFDTCAVALAWVAAYVIRFNGAVPDDFRMGGLNALAGVVATYAVMFRIFGLYRGMWVFASLPDLI